MVCSHECACGSVDRENVADLQAYAHLARYVAVRYPAFANEAVALLCDIFRLREAVVESLEVVGRVSVKDASGIDIRRNCIEVLLVTDPCKMTRNRVGRSNLTPRISQELLLLGGETTLPCLDAVRRFVEDKQIDQSLLRHFTSQVIVAALVVVVPLASQPPVPPGRQAYQPCRWLLARFCARLSRTAAVSSYGRGLARGPCAPG